MISPDIAKDEPFIGTCPESSPAFRKPALGTQEAPEFTNEGLSRADKIFNREKKRWHSNDSVFNPLLQMKLFDKKIEKK